MRGASSANHLQASYSNIETISAYDGSTGLVISNIGFRGVSVSRLCCNIYVLHIEKFGSIADELA